MVIWADSRSIVRLWVAVRSLVRGLRIRGPCSARISPGLSDPAVDDPALDSPLRRHFAPGLRARRRPTRLCVLYGVAHGCALRSVRRCGLRQLGRYDDAHLISDMVAVALHRTELRRCGDVLAPRRDRVARRYEALAVCELHPFLRSAFLRDARSRAAIYLGQSVFCKRWRSSHVSRNSRCDFVGRDSARCGRVSHRARRHLDPVAEARFVSRTFARCDVVPHPGALVRDP